MVTALYEMQSLDSKLISDRHEESIRVQYSCLLPLKGKGKGVKSRLLEEIHT